MLEKINKIEVNNLLQKIDKLLSTKQSLVNITELKNFHYEIKKIIFSNQFLNEKYEKKLKEYNKNINSNKFKQTCDKLLHIINDARFELYIKNPPDKWYPASMYNPILDKEAFINNFNNYKNTMASLFYNTYLFYINLLNNNPDTNKLLFEGNGQVQFIKLSIETLMILAKYENESFDSLMKEFTNNINTSIDFYDLNNVDMFTFDELYVGFIPFFDKISCISVLNELKTYILKAISKAKKNTSENSKKKFLQYSKKNQSFTLAGKPLKLQNYLVKFLKDVYDNGVKLKNKGLGSIRHDVGNQWVSYKTKINKESRKIIGKDILDKEFTFLVPIRGFDDIISI